MDQPQKIILVRDNCDHRDQQPPRFIFVPINIKKFPSLRLSKINALKSTGRHDYPLELPENFCITRAVSEYLERGKAEDTGAGNNSASETYSLLQQPEMKPKALTYGSDDDLPGDLSPGGVCRCRDAFDSSSRLQLPVRLSSSKTPAGSGPGDDVGPKVRKLHDSGSAERLCSGDWRRGRERSFHR